MVLIIALVCIILFIILQNWVYHKYWAKNLEVKIGYKTSDCVVGEQNELVEVIVNNKKLPLPMVHVKFDMPKSFSFENEANSAVSDYYYRDDVFTIMGHQSVTRTLRFTCNKRGCFYMHDTTLVSSDLFLRSILSAKRKNENVIHVFPKKVDVGFFEVPYRTITGSFATNKTLVEDPFEFRGIRQYQPYDCIRHINWKSSAKNDELKVNTYFMTSSQDVMILLNMDTHIYAQSERMIEDMISVASTLCEKLVGDDVPVGFVTNGKDIYTKEKLVRESGSGARHMVSIDTALARIDAHGENLNFAQVLSETMMPKDKEINKRTYYIIVSNARNKEILDVYQESKSIGILSYFIVPEFAQYPVEEVIPDMVQWNIT